jgi:hypothetical protein
MKAIVRLLAALTAVSVCALSGSGIARAQVQGDPAAAARAAAEPQGAGPAPESWGTTSLSVHTINSFEFETLESGTVYSGDGTNGRVVTAGTPCFEAPVLLPSGAIIDHTDLEACDSNGGADVSSILFICNLGSCTTNYSLSSSGAAGCARTAGTPPATRTTVQNDSATYTMQICNGALGNTNSFKSVRIFYRLQVSPAPAVATFPVDVPTSHPFFRFVEAMAASGLTGGCGTGSFCPDQPVTRGQLSVFLASALGLHFPN